MKEKKHSVTKIEKHEDLLKKQKDEIVTGFIGNIGGTIILIAAVSALKYVMQTDPTNAFLISLNVLTSAVGIGVENCGLYMIIDGLIDKRNYSQKLEEPNDELKEARRR